MAACMGRAFLGKGETRLNSWLFLLVGSGGAAGALARYGAGRWVARRGWRAFYATLAVNLAGSFAAGFLLGAQVRSEQPNLYALIGTGFLGGLTTFSTLNVQKASLAAEGQGRTLAKYAAATYAGGWAFVAAGFGLGSAARMIST